MPPHRARAILITGCSSGIGHHCAHALAARGYRVIASARKADDVARLQREGLECIQLDLAAETSVDQAAAEVLERTGGLLFGLFHNGGYGQPGAVEDLERPVLRQQFETNLFGPVQLTRRLLPAMRRAGEGRILVNSSVLGWVALPYRGAYTATKFALEGLFDTLRLELANTSVRVVLIEPGPIRSRFRENAWHQFQAHIDAEHSPHRTVYAAMVRRLTRPGPVTPFTLGPEAVTACVIHALERPRPHAHYPVTFPSRLFGVLRRLLPTAALDAILLRVSRNEHRPPPD